MNHKSKRASLLLKRYNPHHDEQGKFSDGDGAHMYVPKKGTGEQGWKKSTVHGNGQSVGFDESQSFKAMFDKDAKAPKPEAQHSQAFKEPANDKELADLNSKMHIESVRQWSKLSKDSKQAIYDYTGSRYSKMNSEIGYHEGDSSKIKDPGVRKEVEDAQKGLLASSITDDVVLHRAADLGYSGVDTSNLGKLVGSEFVDHSFGSTSIDPSVAKNFQRDFPDRVRLRIEAPKGTKGAYLGNGTGRSREAESEFLLPHSTKYKITGYDAKEKVLHVKIVGQGSDDGKRAEKQVDDRKEEKFVAMHIKFTKVVDEKGGE